jgi:hypothetical protein
MNDYHDFPDTRHIYGYCAYPTAFVDEHIKAGPDFRYHITVIHTDICDPPMDNCVWLVTYVMSLGEFIDYVRQTDDQIISVGMLTNDN